MSKRKEQLEKLRDLPDDELRQALDRATDELFRVKLGHYTNQVENTATIRAHRREVARIQTILRSRARGTESQSAAGTKTTAE